METKIQLLHPAGKKAIRMEKDKYEIMKKGILDCLKLKGEATHKEILEAILVNFKYNKVIFSGSVEWFMEWVKLDLETRNEIKRIGKVSPVKYSIS